MGTVAEAVRQSVSGGGAEGGEAADNSLDWGTEWAGVSRSGIRCSKGYSVCNMFQILRSPSESAMQPDMM